MKERSKHEICANGLLDHAKIRKLRRLLAGRQIVLCQGGGVDSAAMTVLLWICDIRPDVITFADVGAGEKPETMEHLAKMDELFATWEWPKIDRCRKRTLPSTGYSTLEENCLKNETLPSLAFGRKGCSMKWKTSPQDQFIMGVAKGPAKRSPHPIWLNYLTTGRRIVKLIGYDAGPADLRRSKKLDGGDDYFDYAYPLQVVGWRRQDCVEAITIALGADFVPLKSSCFYCPASKEWELYWLAATHPDLFERALAMEWQAMTGRHSRFDEAEQGASWETIVRTEKAFSSGSTTVVGLGRSFSWNKWALANGVVEKDFLVLRRPEDVMRFLERSEALRKADNALDRRCSQDESGVPLLDMRPQATSSSGLLTVNRIVGIVELDCKSDSEGCRAVEQDRHVDYSLHLV